MLPLRKKGSDGLLENGNLFSLSTCRFGFSLSQDISQVSDGLTYQTRTRRKHILSSIGGGL